MEIKRIGGIISSYQAQKAQSPKKTSAAAPAKNTDRVEFGFETALTAAKAAVAAELRADATPQELLEGKNAAERGIDSAILSSVILMG